MSHVGEDFAIAAASPKRLTSLAPDPGPGVEECSLEVDGRRMRYLRAGSGPPVILLHGLMGYSFSWRYTIPGLAPYATVYAPDMLGAGFSDRAPGIDYSMPATANRVLQFADKLGLSCFDLLGTSHGGAVAMFATADCLSRNLRLKVRRLVLVAPVNPYSAHGRRLAPFFATPFGAALLRLAVARMPISFRYVHRRLYADRDHIPAGALDGYMAPMAIPGLFEHALRIVQTWIRDLIELEKTLPQLAQVPTLFLWGRKDPAVYAASAAPLSRSFPNSRTIIFEGIGHLPYEECPEEFNRALIDFVTAKDLPA